MLETELPEIALFLQDVEKITAELEAAGGGRGGGEGAELEEVGEL